jgi:HSP20 family protein
MWFRSAIVTSVDLDQRGDLFTPARLEFPARYPNFKWQRRLRRFERGEIIMSLIPRNNLFDLDRFFNDSWPQSSNSQAATFFAPRVDIKEAGDHYEITAELPGVDKKDIQVHVRDGILTLEAETTKEEKEKKEKKGDKIIRQERRYGKFMRSFNLGADVSEADIKASFKDGVLRLEAPKIVEKVQERRRINIS